MEAQTYKSGEVTIVATPSRNVRNIHIDFYRGAKLQGYGLISLGQLAEMPSAKTAAQLTKMGVAVDSRREYASYPTRLILPVEIAEQIDALSIAAKAEAEIADAVYESQLASIPGLKELEVALNEHERYAEQIEQMMDNEYNDGVRAPRPAAGDLDELRARYPRAAAYVLANAWAGAEHDVKAAAGRAAHQAILQGADHEQAIAEMKKTWASHCDRHVWD